MKGVISEVQWNSTCSVQTTAQPPFGLDAPHVGERGRVAITHAGAMGHLVEAISGGDRPDLDGLKQDVVTRLHAHGITRLVVAG